MARKPRADGSKFALEAAAELARPLPEPPVPLSRDAKHHWPRIIGAKMLNLWTEADLVEACRLCEFEAQLGRLMATIEKKGTIVRVAVRDRSGNVIRDESGEILYDYKDHPAYKQIKELTRLIQATKRALQINSVAVNGPSHHIAGKNETARSIATALDDATDDLIARPKLRVVR